MRKQANYFAAFLFIIGLIETRAQVIHYEQSLLLLNLPKIHSPKKWISPKVLKRYNNVTNAVEERNYIDIEALFKDTVGDNIYYFVGVYPETKTINSRPTSGFLEQKSIPQALIKAMDSILTTQNNCLLILKSDSRYGIVIKQNDKNVPYYNIDKYHCAYLLKPQAFVLQPGDKTLEIPSGKLFLLEYKARFLKKKIKFFNTADAYFKQGSDNSPAYEKYTGEHWTGGFTEGLANGKGVWWSRGTNGKSRAYYNWNIYKGELEDNTFNGEGIYYHSHGVHEGKWSYGKFTSGKAWFAEVNFDTSSYFIRSQFIYGGNLLADDFAPNCEWYNCKINDSAYEGFVIRDTLFPPEMKLNKEFLKSDLHAKGQSIDLIKMAFLLYSNVYFVGGPSFLRPKDTYTSHKNQIFFIVCKNNKSLILKADVDGQSFRYYDSNNRLLADYSERNGFIKGLKQACDCN